MHNTVNAQKKACDAWCKSRAPEPVDAGHGSNGGIAEAGCATTTRTRRLSLESCFLRSGCVAIPCVHGWRPIEVIHPQHSHNGLRHEADVVFQAKGPESIRLPRAFAEESLLRSHEQESLEREESPTVICRWPVGRSGDESGWAQSASSSSVRMN